MKLQINPIAKFFLRKIVLPAIGRAIADGKNPLTKETAKDALERMVIEEARRRVSRG